MSRDHPTMTTGLSYNPFQSSSSDDDNDDDIEQEVLSWNNTTVTTAHRNSGRFLKHHPQHHQQHQRMHPSHVTGGGGEAVFLPSRNQDERPMSRTLSPSSSPNRWEAPKLVDTSLESEASDGSPERGLPSGRGQQGTPPGFGQPSPDRSAAWSRSTGTASSSSSSTSARMLMEERLSIMFDDGSSTDPTCRILGRIHVRLGWIKKKRKNERAKDPQDSV